MKISNKNGQLMRFAREAFARLKAPRAAARTILDCGRRRNYFAAAGHNAI
jgi:hypothetical protein